MNHREAHLLRQQPKPPRWCPNCGDDTRGMYQFTGTGGAILCKRGHGRTLRGCGWMWVPECAACEWPLDTDGNCANPHCEVTDA